MLFRVDPETKLLQLSRYETQWEGRTRAFETRFDYPKKGPADVYDLGVPKTAKLVDRVPANDLTQNSGNHSRRPATHGRLSCYDGPAKGRKLAPVWISGDHLSQRQTSSAETPPSGSIRPFQPIRKAPGRRATGTRSIGGRNTSKTTASCSPVHRSWLDDIFHQVALCHRSRWLGAYGDYGRRKANAMP